MFDAKTFVRKNNTTSRTTFKTEDGCTVRLEGMLAKSTAQGLADLAAVQEKVAVKLPDETIDGHTVKTTAILSAAKGEALIKAEFGLEEKKGKNRISDPAPVPTPGANGAAH